MKKSPLILLMVSVSLLLSISPLRAEEEPSAYDVVVVGSTPAGVAAAVWAAKEGCTTALFSEKQHIGGVPAGGLTNTDFESFQGLGGAWRDFMDRVVAYYTETYGAGSQQVADCKDGGWFEPGVARQVFTEMLADAGVVVFTDHPIESASTITNGQGRRQVNEITLTDLVSDSPVTVSAQVFIDATYEGDLLALAGGDYDITWMQTYNFRICMTQDTSNWIPVSSVKPQKYDEMDFSGFRQYLLNNPGKGIESEASFRDGVNNKKDVNSRAFNADYHFSISGVGWTEGTRAYRQAMFELAKHNAQGFFYFLATDPALSGHQIQSQAQQWGYAADEYNDTDNWSPELYVRQGRQMVGVYEVTSWDRQQPANAVRSRTHADSVAIGDYQSVAHREYSEFGIDATDFLPEGAETVRDWPAKESTGSSQTQQAVDLPDLPPSSVSIGTQNLPFEVPYGSIVPVSLDGLLVPVAVSCDTTMYNAIRMEPTWAALGQAAGVAAAQAVKEQIDPRDVDTDLLRRQLHKAGAMTFYTSDVDRDSPYFMAVQYFGNLGFFHATELIGSPTNYPAPVELGNTQWGGPPRYHDVLLNLIDEPIAAPVTTVVDDFDENLTDTDTVQRVIGGSNLTLSEFETIVEQAFTDGKGGTVDFELEMTASSSLEIGYGENRMILNFSNPLDTVSDSQESISGTRALDAGDADSQSGWEISFDPMPEVFGIVSVDDDARTVDAVLTLDDDAEVVFDRITTDGADALFAYQAPVGRKIKSFRFTSSSWTRWDDLAFFLNNPVPPSQEVDAPPSVILSDAVEQFWRGRYEAVFGAGSLDGFIPTADGTLTRGEYLQALLEHTFEDADLDKLPDAWERQNHSSIFEVEAEDDVDMDGIKERMEMAMDLNPNAPDSNILFPIKVTNESGMDWFEFTFREAAEMGASELVAQKSPDLLPNSWEDLSVDGTTVLKETVDADPDGDGSASLQKYRIHFPLGMDKGFFRLSVRDPVP